MQPYEYKYVSNAFSPKRVLREVEHLERQGWELYSLDHASFFILGSGGTAGMVAVLRRATGEPETPTAQS